MIPWGKMNDRDYFNSHHVIAVEVSQDDKCICPRCKSDKYTNVTEGFYRNGHLWDKEVYECKNCFHEWEGEPYIHRKR